MARIQVREIVPNDIGACAALLASRHRRDMARLPHLDPALREAKACESLIAPLVSNPRADGLIAERDGVPAGFLFGERMMLSPTDFASNFIPPHSIAIPVEGHAFADDADPLEVLRPLYAELAGRWTNEGFFHHRVGIPAGDAGAQEAWVTLGFGRRLTAATRTTSEPVAVAHPRPLRIEQASPEDIDDVMALVDEQNRWHWGSPIFWPVLRTADEAARAFNLNSLRSSGIPYFLAYDEGRAAGMQSFLKPGFTPPIIKGDTNVYLFEGIVARDARGGGIGTALLRESMAWASRSGYDSCTLHFASGNPLGAPFWLGNGFVPIEHTMAIDIDERIAWGRPKD
ncbi:MAG: GNAT family N-acetyltransferase [Dehalococcoidia bacterium]